MPRLFVASTRSHRPVLHILGLVALSFLGLCGLGANTARATNFQVPAGVKGTLVFQYESGGDLAPNPTEFGIIQRDANGNAHYLPLGFNYDQTFDDTFYRTAVNGGETFELYIRRNAIGADHVLDPQVFSSDPTKNTTIDPAQPEHLILQSLGSNAWWLNFDLVNHTTDSQTYWENNYGDWFSTFKIFVTPACDNVTVTCPDPGIVTSNHGNTTVDHRSGSEQIVVTRSALTGTPEGTTPAQASVCVGSRVDNYRWSYVHESVDWAVSQDSAACSCGNCASATSSGPSELKHLEIKRVHRPKYESLPSTFGVGGFSNLDARVDIYAHGIGNQPNVVFFDPETDAPATTFFELSPQDNDNVLDGLYHDTAARMYKGLTLFNDDQPESAPTGNPMLATRAVLTKPTGETYTFAVVPVDSQSTPTHLAGRLVAITDRNKNSVLVDYQFSPFSSDQDLGGDWSKMFLISQLHDMYNVSATFAYSQNPSTLRWRVFQITLPNNDVMTYSYGSGPGDQDVLTFVGYPDGQSSVFSKFWDDTSQTWVLHYDDIANGPSRYVTDVSITGVTYTSTDGVVHSQTAGLVRRIVNANGEQIYQNWEDPNDANTFYTAEGSSRLTRFKTNGAGVPLELAHANAWVTDPLKGVYTVDESYAADAAGHLTQNTNGVGGVTKVVRDAASELPTQIVKPDGATLSQTINSFGQPLHQVDEAGAATDSTYDSFGNVLTLTHAVGTSLAATWTFTHNTRGQITSIKTPLNVTSTYTYDTAGRLTSITDPPDTVGGATTSRSLEYDALSRLSATTDELGHRTTYQYDQRGHQIGTTYPDGTTETTTYGSGYLGGEIIKTTDRLGRITTYDYDSTRRLAVKVKASGTPAALTWSTQYVSGRYFPAVELSDGQRTEFTYDLRDRLTAKKVFVRGTSALTMNSAFDAAGRETTQTDPYGRNTFLVYDTTGRMTRKVRELTVGGVPAGTNLATLARNTSANPPFVIEDFAYDNLDRVVTRTDERNNQTKFTFDLLGKQTKIVEASGTTIARTTNLTYDLAGNRLTVSLVGGLLDGTNVTTAYTYSGRNLQLSETVASGTSVAATARKTYTKTGLIATETDPKGGVVTYAYDVNDRRTSVTDAAGFVTTYVYDAEGHVTSQTDPAGQTATYTYDGRDRRLTEANGAGETTTYQYDDNLIDGAGLDVTYSTNISGLGFGNNADGKAVLRTNAAGDTQLQVKDELDRLVLVRDGNGNAATTTYDTVSSSLLSTKVTNALGKSTTILTDAAGRERTVTDPDSKSTAQSFDAAGNLVSVRDPNSAGRDCVFDALNRRTSCTDTNSDATSWEYDLADDNTANVDGLGNRGTCSYDARKRPTSCVDRLGTTKKFAYDLNSNRTSVTDGENDVTTYAYDARNLQSSITYPDATTDKVSYTYDGNARIKTITDQSSNVFTMAYDLANRLTSVTYPGGTKDTLVYDKASRITSGTSAKYGTTTTRAYDHGGRMTQEVTTTGGRTFTVGLAFDAADRPITITYPDSSTVSRVYGLNRDLVTQVKLGTASIAQFTYDNGSRRTKNTMGNGLVETLTYRADNLPSGISVGTVGTTNYTYDKDKRRLTKTGTAVNGDQTYAYDKEDRVTNFTGPSLTQSWTLSGEGDWKSTTRNGTVENRTHNTVHELTKVGTAALTYDVRGNLTQDDKGNKLIVDVLNRLQEYDTSGGTKVTYAYDVFGRKVARTVGTTTTNYVYLGDEVIAEYNNGTLAIKYVTGPEKDIPLAYVRSGSTFYYSADELGSVQAVTNSSGAVVERYRYTAYGDRTILNASGTVITATTVGNQIGFTGRPHDATTGIIDFRFRHYDARLGRFLSRDDGYNDGLSLYMAYFAPNGTDPTGHGWFHSLVHHVVSNLRAGVDLTSRLEDLGKMALRAFDNWEYGIKADIKGTLDFTDGTGRVTASIWVGWRYKFGVGTLGLSATYNPTIVDGRISWLPNMGGKHKCPNDCCLKFVNLEGSTKLKEIKKALQNSPQEMPGTTLSFSLYKDGCTVGAKLKLEVNALAYIPVVNSIAAASFIMKKIHAGEITAGGFLEGTAKICYGANYALIPGPGQQEYFVGADVSLGAFIKVGKFSTEAAQAAK